MGDPLPTHRRPAGPARCAAAMLLLMGALIGACGGNGDGDGGGERTLGGETETGMKLEVQPLIDPAHDPLLAELDRYRQALGVPPALYTRVTADNTAGPVPDHPRALVFAPDLDTLLQQGGVRTRFTCEALEFEWVPPPGDPTLRAAHAGLSRRLCPNGPPKPESIEPGSREVYYLFVEQGLDTQDLDQMRVFGPLSRELQ